MTVAVYMQVNRFFPHELTQRAEIQKVLTQAKIAPSSVQWFIDRESKSELEQLRKDITKGSIRTFVIFSLEQAYPSIEEITAAIGLLSSKNMTFVSASQNIFLDPSSIESAYSLLSIALNLAANYKRMKQAEGIAKAQAKGLYKGKKPGATKPGFDPKKILRWKARGWNAKRIAQKLGVCESTVFRYLRMFSKK